MNKITEIPQGAGKYVNLGKVTNYISGDVDSMSGLMKRRRDFFVSFKK